MDFQPADPVSVAAFVAVVVSVIGLLLVGAYDAERRLGASAADASRTTLGVALIVLAWQAVISAIVASGTMARMPLSGVPFFFGAVNLAAAIFAFSPTGRRMSLGVPLWALVAFQGFRLPLELVLHAWGAQGTVPLTMTWSGQNLDIIAGIVALLAAPVAKRSRPAAWIANVTGFVLLLNVGRVAVMSSPVPFGWGVRPPLLLALHLPYAWIGSVCVAGALAGHLILTRALLVRARP